MILMVTLSVVSNRPLSHVLCPTELKKLLTQGSVIKDLLWLANDIAYFDSKWGLLDPVSVSISFEEEYYYVIPIL